jgi:DNA-binding transcriptional LysR family regulator
VRWLRDRIPVERFVFRAVDNRVLRDAILSGVGIGFISTWEAERFDGLVQLFDPKEEWSAPLWLVTHVDLHRTTKVQTFLKFLKAEAKTW